MPPYATPPGTANKMLVLLNGSTLLGEQAFPFGTAINIFRVECIVTMNGTTDYIVVQLAQGSGGSVNTGGTNPDGGNYNNITIDRLHA